jgi:flavodoxin
METFLQTPPMQQNLAHLKVAVIGLGSRDYPKFCTAADILESWATQKQLQLAAPTLRIDGFPADPQPLTTWAAQLK